MERTMEGRQQVVRGGVSRGDFERNLNDVREDKLKKQMTVKGGRHKKWWWGKLGLRGERS